MFYEPFEHLKSTKPKKFIVELGWVHYLISVIWIEKIDDSNNWVRFKKCSNTNPS